MPASATGGTVAVQMAIGDWTLQLLCNDWPVILDQEFKSRGRRIAWACRGSGPAVIFCHGTPWSSVLWSPFADALAASFTV